MNLKLSGKKRTIKIQTWLKFVRKQRFSCFSEMQELKNLENSHLAILLVDSIFQRGCPILEPHCKTLPLVSNHRHPKVRILFSYITIFSPLLSNEAHGSDLGNWPSDSPVDDGLERRWGGACWKRYSLHLIVSYTNISKREQDFLLLFSKSCWTSLPSLLCNRTWVTISILQLRKKKLFGFFRDSTQKS